MKPIAAFICLAIAAVAPAIAGETDTKGKDAMKMDMATSAEGAPSTKAFESASQRMHAAMMMAPYTGDADVDFATQMLPHHGGAVEMAKIEQQYGKDPELRKLAEDIIKAQDQEIAFLNAWLAKHKK
jgi:uncharacterized protein (DUF305 family)